MITRVKNCRRRGRGRGRRRRRRRIYRIYQIFDKYVPTDLVAVVSPPPFVTIFRLGPSSTILRILFAPME
jgi:hypothetical protein